MDNRDIAAAIKQAVRVPDLVSRYGLIPNRGGFIHCPLHGERTPSLKVHQDFWHCFGCGAGGDAISWVQAVDGVSFTDACKKLDAMYSLGLYDDIDPVIARALQNRATRADTERKEAAQNAESLESAFWSAFDRWRTLDKVLTNAAPSSLEQVSEELAAALQEYPSAVQAVREAEWALLAALGNAPGIR